MILQVVVCLVIATLNPLAAQQNCDLIIRSEVNGLKFGNFSSPNYPRNYANDQNCMIKFIGLFNERVVINFTDFKLEGFQNRLTGVSTGCTNDFIDIYTHIEHPEHDLVEHDPQGRYCGMDVTELPHMLMSYNRTIVITFKSDSYNTAKGFSGFYEFTGDAPFSMGTPAPFGVCGWTVRSNLQQTGVIMAPYWPAMYPDNLDCFYLLTGSPGQRIKLQFTDFDLFYGGDHCPFDYLRIYAGNSTLEPEIGTYCNHLDGLVVYSTGPSMYIRFRTQPGRPRVEYDWGEKKIQMRGFRAAYTFSDSYVDLSFVRPPSEHLRGTECDVRVKSLGESNGTIVTPNYPLPAPPNITCFFYVDGLIDMQNLEKVILKFDSISFPSTAPGASCENVAHVATYLYGQKPSADNPDSYICSNRTSELVSKSPRLALKFTTNGMIASKAIGFSASFRFVMDYAIDGTPANLIMQGPSCHYYYYSSSTKAGKVNSPRYPSAYPSELTCTYEFIPQPNEFIMVSFDTFDVERISHSEGDCLGDNLSATSVLRSSSNITTSIPMGTYCGTAFPGPFVSEWVSERMILSFRSDKEISRRGFLAKYEFLHSAHRFPCGGNITEGGSGEIVPPNYPLKYQVRTVCDWFIYRKKANAQIKITFEHFDIEGTMEEGCQGAVLRIYKRDEYRVDHEICGQKPPVNNIVSENGFIRIRFISSSKSFGKTGFKISWTEIIRNEGGRRMSHMNILYIVIAIVILLLLGVLIIICVCLRRGDNRNTAQTKTSLSPTDITADRMSNIPMLVQSGSNNGFQPYSSSTLSSKRSYKDTKLGTHPYNMESCLTSL